MENDVIEFGYDQAAVARTIQRLRAMLGFQKWLKKALERVGNYMVQSTRQAIFVDGRAVSGAPFIPLSNEYVNRPYRKGGRGGNRKPILSRSGPKGGLMQSLTYRVYRDGVKIYPSGARGQLIGAAHQDSRRKRLPKRPWLGFRKYRGDQKEIEKIINEELVRVAK